MRYKSIAAFFFGSLVFLAVSAGPALADDLYGRIRGTVTDPSGAVIAGVKVIAKNINTGISKQTTSGPDAHFSGTSTMYGSA